MTFGNTAAWNRLPTHVSVNTLSTYVDFLCMAFSHATECPGLEQKVKYYLLSYESNAINIIIKSVYPFN